MARAAWRGVTVCDCMPPMLDSLAASVGPTVIPVQGGYSTSVSASAQTHAGGGVADISIRGWSEGDIAALVRESRRRGWVAWRRTAAQGFTPHVHGVLDSCPHLSKGGVGYASWQVSEYRAGRNGLAGRGRDDGPRDFVGATWWAYRDSHPNQPATTGSQIGDDMIVIGCLGANDPTVPDGVQGKIVLCLPGFPQPYWLNADEWGFIVRLFPYWAGLPGSPFFWAEANRVNAMLQPPSGHGATPDQVQERVVNILRAPEFQLNVPGQITTITYALNAVLRDPAFGLTAEGLTDTVKKALIDQIVKVVVEVQQAGGSETTTGAAPERALGMDLDWNRTEGGATIDMCPRLRGDAGRTPGPGLEELLSEFDQQVGEH